MTLILLNLKKLIKIMYYEVDCKVEMKPKSTKAFINRVTLGFDHSPHYYEVTRKLAERYPEVNLVGIFRCWEASSKAKWLMDYYNR